MKIQTKKETSAKRKLGVMFYLKRDWQLYALIAIPLLFIIVFKLLPLLGLSIAFLDYNPILGFSDSPFIGFSVFKEIFTSREFLIALRNTLVLIGTQCIRPHLRFPDADYTRNSPDGDYLRMV